MRSARRRPDASAGPMPSTQPVDRWISPADVLWKPQASPCAVIRFIISASITGPRHRYSMVEGICQIVRHATIGVYVAS
jgi:hypothetical protein